MLLARPAFYLSAPFDAEAPVKDRDHGRFPRHVAIHLALGFIAIVAIIAVAILARQVTDGTAIAQFDEKVANALHRNTTPGWHQTFRFVTLLGTGWALGIAAGLVGLVLLLRRHITLAIAWAVAQGGAVILVKIIKAMVERTRPSVADPSFYAHGWSFPSGHVVRTFAFCAMAAYLVFRLTRSWPATLVAAAAGVVCSLVMAFSRVYLGAHFVSDVVAGLIVGTAWVAVCIGVTEEALRRSGRRAESPD
jgi:membrane-associated phospholipid phosphatase